MTNENEVSRENKDKELSELLATEQKGNSVTQDNVEKEKPKIANPDEEDPRLYSPLQEPDSPPVEERKTEKQAEEEKKPD